VHEAGDSALLQRLDHGLAATCLSARLVERSAGKLLLAVLLMSQLRPSKDLD